MLYLAYQTHADIMKGGILGSVIHKLMEPDEPKPQQIEEYELDDIIRQLQMHAQAWRSVTGPSRCRGALLQRTGWFSGGERPEFQ